MSTFSNISYTSCTGPFCDAIQAFDERLSSIFNQSFSGSPHAESGLLSDGLCGLWSTDSPFQAKCTTFLSNVAFAEMSINCSKGSLQYNSSQLTSLFQSNEFSEMMVALDGGSQELTVSNCDLDEYPSFAGVNFTEVTGSLQANFENNNGVSSLPSVGLPSDVDCKLMLTTQDSIPCSGITGSNNVWVTYENSSASCNGKVLLLGALAPKIGCCLPINNSLPNANIKCGQSIDQGTQGQLSIFVDRSAQNCMDNFYLAAADGSTQLDDRCESCGTVPMCNTTSCSNASDSVCSNCFDGYFGDNCTECSDIVDKSSTGNVTCTNITNSRLDGTCRVGYWLDSTGQADECRGCATIQYKAGNATVSCSNASDSYLLTGNCSQGYVLSRGPPDSCTPAPPTPSPSPNSSPTPSPSSNSSPTPSPSSNSSSNSSSTPSPSSPTPSSNSSSNSSSTPSPSSNSSSTPSPSSSAPSPSSSAPSTSTPANVTVQNVKFVQRFQNVTDADKVNIQKDIVESYASAGVKAADVTVEFVPVTTRRRRVGGDVNAEITIKVVGDKAMGEELKKKVLATPPTWTNLAESNPDAAKAVKLAWNPTVVITETQEPAPSTPTPASVSSAGALVLSATIFFSLAL